MHDRSVTTLTNLAGVLCLGEVGSAFVIWQENYRDAQPLFAVVFAVLFLAAAGLVRTGRVVGGAILVTLLCLFELVSFPSWTRHRLFDAISQSGYALLALTTLVVALVVLVGRWRATSTTG